MMHEAFLHALAEFGRRVGLPSLEPGAGGTADLSIERVGRLQLEQDGDCVLATLARPWPEYAGGTALAALELCHWRENHPWVIHAGAKGGDWITLTARLSLAEFDLPTLEKLIGYLSGLLDAVEKAG